MVGIWHDVGSADSLTDELSLRVAGKENVLVGRIDGELRACVAKCPHAGVAMERPDIEGSIVTCPLHGWRFDLNCNGREIHGYRPLATRDVKIENGTIFVMV